jgi:tRNA-dihydrouridine synthase B
MNASARIGPWTLQGRALLAPMAGVTDRPFRILCRRFGAALAASEMITADQRLWHTTKTRQRMNHEGEPEPRVVQLAGHDPAQLAEAARRTVDLGAQIIDINMGCPAKKVYGKLCGSALLDDEPLVARLLDAVVSAVTVPVTLKIRTGVSRARINAVRIAQIAAQSGVAAIAIHGRTREDFYTGEAEYHTIREVCAAQRIPVFANGDITSAEKARAVLDFTGATGVMLGRAAHGFPWIFRDVNGFIENGQIPAPLLRAQIRDIILGHLESLYDFHGETSGVRIARKHLGWYCQQHTMTARFRSALMAAESSSSQFALARQCFEEWVQFDNNNGCAEQTDAEYEIKTLGRDHAQALHHQRA